MVPELIVELDFGLHFGREIFKVVRQSGDMPGIEVVRYSRVRIELFIHVDRLKVLKWSFCEEVFRQHVPCLSVHSRRARAAANRRIKASSIGRSSHGRCIRTVMALPVLPVHRKPRQELRVESEIHAVAVKVPLTTPIDEGPGIVGGSLDHGKADKRDVVSKQSEAGVHRLRLIGPTDPGRVTDDPVCLKIVVVHDPDHVLEAIENLPSNVDEIIAFLKKLDGTAGPGGVAFPASHPIQVGRTDDVPQTAGGLRKDAEGHTKNSHSDEVEVGRPRLNRSNIDIGFAKEGRHARTPDGGTAITSWSAACQASTLELHQHMPSGQIVAQFSPEHHLGPSNREAVLAFPFRDIGIHMSIQKLQRVQAEIHFIP